MSEKDSTAIKRIAYQTRRDAVAMRTIAIVTLFFLPATFVSTFFSMSFFQVGGPLSLHYIWLYFLFALLTSICVIGVWYFWYKRIQERKQDVHLESSANYKKKYQMTKNC